jgi:hypothetical protein
MKTIAQTIFLLILCAGLLNAQEPSKEEMEKIQSLRIAFLSQQMELSPEQAQLFWPIFNEYDDELRKIGRAHRGIMQALENQELNEKETTEQIMKSFELEEAELKIKLGYFKQFNKVLPAQQLAKLFAAEHAFRRKMLKELHKRKMRRSKEAPGREWK